MADRPWRLLKAFAWRRVFIKDLAGHPVNESIIGCWKSNLANSF